MIFSESRFLRESKHVKSEFKKDNAILSDFAALMAFRYPKIIKIHNLATRKIRDIYIRYFPYRFHPDELSRIRRCGYNTRVNAGSIEEKEFSFRELPHYQMNDKIIKLALKIDGGLIGFVPVDLLTHEYVMLAVSNGYAILFVPYHMINHDVITKAISMRFRAIGSIPEELLTNEHIMQAININVRALEEVPTRMITHEMATLAIRKDGMMLLYIPDRLITPDLIIEALNQNEKAISYVHYDTIPCIIDAITANRIDPAKSKRIISLLKKKRREQRQHHKNV